MATSEKNGQAAVEALIYIGVFLFLTVFFSLFLLQQQAIELRNRQYALSSQVAGEISDAITLATVAGPGFNSTFRIPTQIMGRKYLINLSSTGSLFITLPYPPVSGESNVTFYHPIGARGLIYKNPNNPGANQSIYVGQSGYSFFSVWFNSSTGIFSVWVNGTGAVFLG
jgi:hypothetical protein